MKDEKLRKRIQNLKQVL